MPTNGLVYARDYLELYISSSGSGSHSGAGSGVYTHGASGSTKSTPDTSNLDDGFLFSLTGSSASDTWRVDYTGPGALSGTYWTGSGWTSVDAQVTLSDVRLYSDGATWYLTASYEVFAQGVSRLTGSISEIGAGLGPAYIPLIGVAFNVAGSCTAATTGLPSYGDTDVYDYNSSATATASGGWRDKDVGGSTWNTYPVSIISGGGIISASSTYGLQVDSYAYHRKKNSNTGTYTCDYCEFGTVEGPVPGHLSPPAFYNVWKKENWDESKTGNVRGVPDLEKAIERFGDDTAFTLDRTEMPQTKQETITSGVSVVSEVHPHQAVIRVIAGNTVSAAEDTFGYLSYAPSSWGHPNTYSYTQYYETVTPGVCVAGDPGTIDCTFDTSTHSTDTSTSHSFPSYVGPSSDMATYLSHDIALARYINSWCNPHWSFALVTSGYEVDGTLRAWNDYGSKVGSQWLDDIAAGLTRDTRNHLVSEGLANDGNASFGDSYLGGLRWCGVSRWLTKAISPRTSYTGSSSESGLWSATDATLTHSTAITVNPSALTCEVSMTLGSFTILPYMWPHLADKFTCDWSTTNVSDLKVYLEGSDGSRVLLNDNDPGTAKYRPQGTATKYAGSWAFDFGADGVTDTGSDDLGAGESSTVVASAERSYAPQLLPGWTAAKLVYVITVADVDVDATIEYPLLEYTKSADRLLTWEWAHQCNVVHPDGPGVRFGMWDTGTSGTVNNPPALYDGYTRGNAIDWRVTRNLTVLGVAYNDGLTTELTTDRDTFEGQSVGTERNNSHGFWLPPKSSDWALAIVSSLAEVPPLGAFPYRKRNETTWEADGDYAQVVWIWAQEPDKFVNPDSAHLFYSSVQWTASGAAVSGWKLTKHTHAVDNTETGAKIKVSTTDYATVRPFRGAFSVIKVSEVVRALWNAHTPWGHYHRESYVDTVGIRHSRAHFVAPVDGFDAENDVYAAGVQARFAYDPHGILVSAFNDGTDTFEYESYDDGESFKYVATIIPTSINPHVTVLEDGTRIFTAFVYDSGSSGPGKIHRAYKLPGDASYSSPAAIQDGSGDIAFTDATHCIAKGPDGTLVLAAQKDGSSDTSEWYSHDLGETWTES